MQRQIRSGVTLEIIPTQQFKTTRIMISFLRELTDRRELAMRTLLANLLEISSKPYNTQKKVAEKLAKLYGASFGTTVSRRGRIHSLNFVLNVVDSKYLLNPEDILEEAFSFLEAMICEPLVDENGFEKITFERQKENLEMYIKAAKDDKRSYAASKVAELYFDDPLQGVPNYGTSEDLETITSEELYAYYLEMLQNDQIQIFISGDMLQDEVIRLAEKMPFKERKVSLGELAYTQPIREDVFHEVERKNLNQSKLDLVYRLPVIYRQPDHYAAVIFNALLGGTPQSKLFVNVREKESLAYYASSSFDPFRQYLLIQTGIKASDKEKAMTLIKKQVKDIQAGEFSLEEFEEIKLNLINSYESRLDSQMTAIIRRQLDLTCQVEETQEAWVKKIKSVSKRDVQKSAKEARLQAVFFLDGGIPNGDQ